MRACLVRDAAPVVVDDHPDPEVPSEHVLVRVAHVAITLRDIVALRRHARGVSLLPDVLGHACIGTVIEATKSASFGRGVRVAVWPDLVCGTCDMCRGGYRAHCRDKRVLGLDGADGVLAERIAVPAISCIELPNDLSNDEAILCFALASAVQAAQAIGAAKVGHITVLGASAEAVLTVALLAKMHPSARLLSASESALNACEKMGVRHRDIRAAGRHEDQDIMIDCTASSRGLATALEMVRPGGRVLLLASPPAEPFDIAPIIDRELVIEGRKPISLQPAIDVLVRGELNVEGLITSRVPFARAPEAFERVTAKGQLQVVIDMA